MNKNIIGAITTIIAILVVIWILNKSGSSEQGNIINSTEQFMPVPFENADSTEESVVYKQSDATAEKSFTVVGKNFSFSVGEIRVKKGDKVSVTFTNESGFHDWRLDEFGVGTKQLKDGESETITFIADKAGTFEYYCSIGKHRQMGMKGLLIVEE